METVFAPPGAGLPKFELLFLRTLFALYRRLKNRGEVSAEFQRQFASIKKLVADVTDNDREKIVLIPRIQAIEDSSRNWSVNMTLAHLTIVNNGIVQIIEGLSSKAAVTLMPVEIAAVKPPTLLPAKALERFEDSCAVLLVKVGVIADLRSTRTHRHPWFGALNSFDWYCISALHMGTHRKQIECILARLT